eukprot:Nk52_evm1s710 gene=Nk52_evmTU1s710
MGNAFSASKNKIHQVERKIDNFFTKKWSSVALPDTVNTVAISTDESSKIRDQLLKDVVNFYVPRRVDLNVLVSIGPNAFPIVTDDDSYPVVVASCYGDGRILAIGSACYLTADARLWNDMNMRNFFVNVFHWLMENSDVKNVGIHMWVYSVKELLKELDIQYNKIISFSDYEELQQYGAILLKPNEIFTTEERDCIRKYIKEGGSVLAADAVWHCDAEGYKGRHQLNCNRLLIPAGIGYSSKRAAIEKPDMFDMDLILETHNIDTHMKGIDSYTVIQEIMDMVLQKDEGVELEYFRRLKNVFLLLLECLNPAYSLRLLPDCEEFANIIVTVDSQNPVGEDNMNEQAIILLKHLNWMQKSKISASRSKCAESFPGVPPDYDLVGEQAFRKTPYQHSFKYERGWQSTGLYCLPGETVNMSFVRAGKPCSITMQVGCHIDSLWNVRPTPKLVNSWRTRGPQRYRKRDCWKRWPDIVSKHPVEGPETELKNPHGGLIYLCDITEDPKLTAGGQSTLKKRDSNPLVSINTAKSVQEDAKKEKVSEGGLAVTSNPLSRELSFGSTSAGKGGNMYVRPSVFKQTTATTGLARSSSAQVTQVATTQVQEGGQVTRSSGNFSIASFTGILNRTPSQTQMQVLPTIDVTFTNAIRAPLFILNVTSTSEWEETIRHYPAPWAELVSPSLILTVPSGAIRNLVSPTAILRYWDDVVSAFAEFVGDPLEKPQRIVADIQLASGFMHSGDPVMIHLDSVPDLLDLSELEMKGHFGIFHELGHNFQNMAWTFKGFEEATCNLFGLYFVDCYLKGNSREAVGWDNLGDFNGVFSNWKGKGLQYMLLTNVGMIASDDTLNPIIDCVSVYDIGMAGAKFGSKPKESKCHSLAKLKKKYPSVGNVFDSIKVSTDPIILTYMFLLLKDGFGWDSLQNLFYEYRLLLKSEQPRTDQDKIDRFVVYYSQIVEKNLSLFFSCWKLKLSQNAEKAINHLPMWLPRGICTIEKAALNTFGPPDRTSLNKKSSPVVKEEHLEVPGYVRKNSKSHETIIIEHSLD